MVDFHHDCMFFAPPPTESLLKYNLIFYDEMHSELVNGGLTIILNCVALIFKGIFVMCLAYPSKPHLSMIIFYL